MEVVPIIARERRDFVALLKRLHADNALALGFEQIRIVGALIELELLHRCHHAVIFTQCLLHIGAPRHINEALSFALLITLAASCGVAPDPADSPDDDHDADDEANHGPVNKIAVQGYNCSQEDEAFVWHSHRDVASMINGEPQQPCHHHKDRMA